MSGQPKKFDVVAVVAKEKPAGIVLPVAPATTIQVGDKLTLKTYLRVSGDAMTNGYVNVALGTGTVKYYFEDLDSGGNPLKIDGGAITPVTANDANIALGLPGVLPLANPGVIAGELADLAGTPGLDSTGNWYLSIETADITTGKAAPADLVVPPPQTAGSWRVLTAVWGGLVGGQPSQVSAHDDNLLIQVTT